MEVGIIGLPKSGKTTIFNAVTAGSAIVDGFAKSSNIGVAKVPDKRLLTLSNLFNPKRTTPAEITFIDLPPPPDGIGDTRGISGEFLNNLQAVDVLLLVCRSFSDPSVIHVDDLVDFKRDAESMMYELIFSDIDLVSRRIDKLLEKYKGASKIDRASLDKEKDFFSRLKDQLGSNIAIREQDITTEEWKILVGYQLLTAKPVITVVNIDENQIQEQQAMLDQLGLFKDKSDMGMTTMCGKLEMELAQMDKASEKEFREDLGMQQSGMDQAIDLSYQVGAKISFFTVGEDEVKAWEIPSGISVQRAAGKIHTDLERGFIRAEVIHYEELISCSGVLSDARKKGLLRSEGKDYIVRDGDVVNVLFNV